MYDNPLSIEKIDDGEYGVYMETATNKCYLFTVEADTLQVAKAEAVTRFTDMIREAPGPRLPEHGFFDALRELCAAHNVVVSAWDSDGLEFIFNVDKKPKVFKAVESMFGVNSPYPFLEE